MKKKHYSYRELFKRAQNAIDADYFLEASWICSTIIEDRFVSILKQSGGNLLPNGKEIRMIGPKIIEINKRKATDMQLESVLYENILDEISTWKDERNKLMHALAKNGSYDDFYKEIYLLGTNGIELAKKISTRARKLKKLKK